MAMPMPETFADGWYDAYNNWVPPEIDDDDFKQERHGLGPVRRLK
jgi:hypothetical protein